MCCSGFFWYPLCIIGMVVSLWGFFSSLLWHVSVLCVSEVLCFSLINTITESCLCWWCCSAANKVTHRGVLLSSRRGRKITAPIAKHHCLINCLKVWKLGTGKNAFRDGNFHESEQKLQLLKESSNVKRMPFRFKLAVWCTILRCRNPYQSSEEASFPAQFLKLKMGQTTA